MTTKKITAKQEELAAKYAAEIASTWRWSRRPRLCSRK
jgi:hypothetical protein